MYDNRLPVKKELARMVADQANKIEHAQDYER